MIRSALLLCAALFSGCVACAQIPSTAPPPPPPQALRACTAQNFANAVQVLSAGYDPSRFIPPNPGATTALDPNSQVWRDLVAAFNAAPPWFRNDLCHTTIYIDVTSCPDGTSSCFGSHSWGYRNPNYVQSRYIALSQRLWDSGPAPAYSEYETTLLAQVMLQQQMPWRAPLIRRPTFSPAMSGDNVVDGSAVTVLAALAHEYGHILWYDLLKAPNDYQYDPNLLCRSPGQRDGFFDKSWSLPVLRPPPFLGFADTTNNDQHGLGIVQIDHLRQAINRSDYATAAKLLYYFYSDDMNNRSGKWPSLFGALSPEEDLVETFKMDVLTDINTNGGSPITSMILNIYASAGLLKPTYTPDIFSDLADPDNKKELKRKRGCINLSYSFLRGLLK